jgi:hypothetical protein
VADGIAGRGERVGEQLASGAGLGLGEDQDVLLPSGQPGQLPLGALAGRRGDTFPGLGPDWLRIAVRDPATSGAFARSLREVLT